MNSSGMDLINKIASQASFNNDGLSENATQIFELGTQVAQTTSLIQSFASDYPNDNELAEQASSAGMTAQQVASLVADNHQRVQVANAAVSMTKLMADQAQSLISAEAHSASVTDSYAALASSYRDQFNDAVADLYQSLADSAANNKGSDISDELNSLASATSQAATDINQQLNIVNQDYLTVKSASQFTSNALVAAGSMASSHASSDAMVSRIVSRNAGADAFSSAISAAKQQSADQLAAGYEYRKQIDTKLGQADQFIKQINAKLSEISRTIGLINQFGARVHTDDISATVKQVNQYADLTQKTASNAASIVDVNHSLAENANSANYANGNVERITSLAVSQASSFNVAIQEHYQRQDYGPIITLDSKADVAASIAHSGAQQITDNTDIVMKAGDAIDTNGRSLSAEAVVMASASVNVKQTGQSLADANHADDLEQLIRMIDTISDGDAAVETTDLAARYQQEQQNYQRDYQLGQQQAQSDRIVPAQPLQDSTGYLDGYIQAFNHKLIIHPNHSYNHKSVYVYRKDKDNKSKVSFVDLTLTRLGRYQHRLMRYYVNKRRARLYHELNYQLQSATKLISGNY